MINAYFTLLYTLWQNRLYCYIPLSLDRYEPCTSNETPCFFTLRQGDRIVDAFKGALFRHSIGERAWHLLLSVTGLAALDAALDKDAL